MLRPTYFCTIALFQSRARRRDSHFQHHIKLTDPLVLKHQQAMLHALNPATLPADLWGHFPLVHDHFYCTISYRAQDVYWSLRWFTFSFCCVIVYRTCGGRGGGGGNFTVCSRARSSSSLSSSSSSSPTLQFSSAQSVAPLAKIHFSPRVWRRPPSISLFSLSLPQSPERGGWRRSVLLSRASIMDN